MLDVTFRKDGCRVRKDHAPHNFAALRKLALALLRQDTQYPKGACALEAKLPSAFRVSRFIARTLAPGVNAIAL